MWVALKVVSGSIQVDNLWRAELAETFLGNYSPMKWLVNNKAKFHGMEPVIISYKFQPEETHRKKLSRKSSNIYIYIYTISSTNIFVYLKFS
jgi:hypothetical protein